MPSYPINQSPPIEDGAGGTLGFTEVRVCLECAKVYEVKEFQCPNCASLNHTRTVLIVHMRSVDGAPKVTIRNFGND